MTATVAIIQGANGGLGKAFVQYLLQHTRFQVVGTSRDPSAVKESLLSTMEDVDESRLHLIKMDLMEEASIVAAAGQVESTFGKGSVKLLVNVSGVVRQFYPFGVC